MESVLNGLRSHSCGLILWENDARGLIKHVKNQKMGVCSKNGVHNGKNEFIKNEIGPEWGRE